MYFQARVIKFPTIKIYETVTATSSCSGMELFCQVLDLVSSCNKTRRAVTFFHRRWVKMKVREYVRELGIFVKPMFYVTRSISENIDSYAYVGG